MYAYRTGFYTCTPDSLHVCFIVYAASFKEARCYSTLQLTSVLDGYMPAADHYYYEYAKFAPYQLDDAVIGTVHCDIVNATSDYNDLLPYIANAASNTTVLAEGFADFYPTTAVGFHYENILT